MPALDATVVGQLYKIAQEAVTNAIKHGKAKRVTISLDNGGDTLSMTIQNNGLPFPDLRSKSTGMGLRIMNYRANLIGASPGYQICRWQRHGRHLLASLRKKIARGVARPSSAVNVTPRCSTEAGNKTSLTAGRQEQVIKYFNHSRCGRGNLLSSIFACRGVHKPA